MGHHVSKYGTAFFLCQDDCAQDMLPTFLHHTQTTQQTKKKPGMHDDSTMVITEAKQN